MPNPSILLSVVASLSLLGCATTGVATSPRTLGRGNTSVGVEALVSGRVYADPASAEGILPALSVEVTHGATEHVDVGARLGTHGAGAQFKWRLIDGWDKGGATVAIAPWVHGFLLIDSSMAVGLPVLVGIRLGEATELVASASMNYVVFDGWGLFRPGYDGQFIIPGAGLGLLTDLTPAFRIGPHLQLYGPNLLRDYAPPTEHAAALVPAWSSPRGDPRLDPGSPGLGLTASVTGTYLF